MLPNPGTSSEFQNFSDIPEFCPQILKYPKGSGSFEFFGTPSELLKISERNSGTFDSHGMIALDLGFEINDLGFSIGNLGYMFRD